MTRSQTAHATPAAFFCGAGILRSPASLKERSFTLLHHFDVNCRIQSLVSNRACPEPVCLRDVCIYGLLDGGQVAHRICRMTRSLRVEVVKPPFKQPAGSPNASPGFMLASVGMNCSAPMACCVVTNAVGAVTNTASAYGGTVRGWP